MAYTLCVALVAIGVSNAQVLYNQQRDEAAKKALTLAEGVSNGAIFDKQLANLERMNRLSQERVFAEAEIQMRANLLTFGSWSKIEAFLTQVRARISNNQANISGAEFNKAKSEATQSVNEASDKLKALQDAVASTSALQTFGDNLDRVARLNDLRKFIEGLPKVGDGLSLPKAYSDAADEISKLAKSLAALYSGFQITLPKSTERIALETHLATLLEEESHLSALAAIAARRDREIGDTLDGIEELTSELKQVRTTPGPDELGPSISAIISAAKTGSDADRKKNKDALGIMLHALYGAASLAARDDTAERLANLRIAAEDRASSISQSAAVAKGYEQIILNGAQRLSMYYQGGIKPQTLGQMLNALATLGLVPTVLTR